MKAKIVIGLMALLYLVVFAVVSANAKTDYEFVINVVKITPGINGLAVIVDVHEYPHEVEESQDVDPAIVKLANALKTEQDSIEFLTGHKVLKMEVRHMKVIRPLD